MSIRRPTLSGARLICWATASVIVMVGIPKDGAGECVTRNCPFALLMPLTVAASHGSSCGLGL
jgi:hypothetical protein